MDIKASDNYAEKKMRLSAFVKECAESKLTLSKDTSNLFRARVKGGVLNVRDFNAVLHVDPENLVAEIEGMATYETIVRETLKYSCLPTVVPQLKSITIGGALVGCGIESSSFKYGLVHETIQEAEVLLSDGRVVLCTPHNAHKDLFFALPNSYGTLGYVLKVKVQLIPVKKFVRLEHTLFSDPALYFEEFDRGEKAAYMDGVVFSKDQMIITKGAFVDEAPYTSNYRYMNIFYKSLRQRKEDYLTTEDYIWRWDTDWFWCSKNFFMHNPLLRFLLGKWMLNSQTYTKIMRFEEKHGIMKMFGRFQKKRETIIQDVLIPIESAGEFFDFFAKNIGITPIWICPSVSREKFDLCLTLPGKLYLDFGFWDRIVTTQEDGYYNREIEKKATALKGFKSLYSSCHYTEEEFWSLYDRAGYQQHKQTYDAKGLLYDLYEKCR